MSYRRFQIYFFVAVLAMSAAATLFVFFPYLTLLAFGGVVAILAKPLYTFLLRWFKSETAAAFLSVVCVAVLAFLPTVLFITALSGELIGIFSNVKNYFANNTAVAVLQKILPSVMHDQIPVILGEVLGIFRGAADSLSRNLFNLFSNIAGAVFGFLVILICAYYLLKDGGRVKKELLALSPLGDEYDELVFHRVALTVRSVMTGVLVVGLIKGVLSGVAFLLLGVPAPFFWGSMAGLASFLPLFGSALVTVPATLYLFLIGNWIAGFVLLFLSVAIIGTIDNFLQPKLVESKTKIHPLLVLLSILGGLQVYGFSGFVLGPLTLAITIGLIDIYKKEFRHYVEKAE